jgi:hypothetical protein
MLENRFEVSVEVGVCRPLSHPGFIVTLFGAMSMLDNTDSFLFFQNLLWLFSNIKPMS